MSATTAPDCAAPAAPSERPPPPSAPSPPPTSRSTSRPDSAYAVPWTVLAAIGAIESDHGRSTAPGVRSGVNAFGCCAGPMQFNLSNGPPSTWQAYRVDGDADGDTDPYDPADAIASAAHYLARCSTDARGDLAAAVYGYNHSRAYVADVLARARTYSDTPEAALVAPPISGAGCAAPDAATGPPTCEVAERREQPRAYAMLPAWAMAGGRPAQPIDARLLDNALWLLRTYRLRVTAAREGGHNTHGDGTALDLIPAEPVDQAAWDASRRRARARPRLDAAPAAHPASDPPARSCRRSSSSATRATPGTARRAPAAAPCRAHLHISWASPCYGTSAPSPPCPWVDMFSREALSR